MHTAEQQGPQDDRKPTKGPSWYLNGPVQIPPPMRTLLETYSGIPPDDVVAHVSELREQAWKRFPYPCVGTWDFLVPAILDHPYYEQVLTRLKPSPSTNRISNESSNGTANGTTNGTSHPPSPKFLDLGCAFAQDIRLLLSKGIPFHNLYGFELEPELIKCGHDLFLDAPTLSSQFMTGDIFNPPPPLLALTSQLSIIYCCNFFHLFSLASQTHIATTLVSLLDPVPGSVVMGFQAGREYMVRKTEMPMVRDGEMVIHCPESWGELWEEVGRRTGSKWDVKAGLMGDGDWRGTGGEGMKAYGFVDGESRGMWFFCERVG